MPRRKIENENIRKIQKSSGSYLISLPIDEVRGLKWKEGQKVVVKKKGSKFEISDWPARNASRNVAGGVKKSAK